MSQSVSDRRINGSIKHFFIYVFDRPDDPFAGLKDLLRNSSRVACECEDLRLQPQTYELINRIDYSGLRKRLRFLYYRRVFKELEDLITSALSQCGSGDVAVIYFSDEGVWAEFWKQLRSRLRLPATLVGVNVQHGWLRLQPASGIPVRKFLNILTKACFGSLAFGLGALGGSGAGVFDIYLVYSQEAAEFVARRTGDRAYPCPWVIKHNLVVKFGEERKRAIASGHPCQDVLMALQPPPFRGLRAGATTLDMMREWLPIARILREEHKRRVVIRRHPGTPQEEFDAAYRESGIAAFADPDTQIAVHAALARSQIVFSYMSTVLFEADLFGLTPVSVCGGLYDDNLHTLPHIRLDLRLELKQQIGRLIGASNASFLRAQSAPTCFDWESVLLKQIGQDSHSAAAVPTANESTARQPRQA